MRSIFRSDLFKIMIALAVLIIMVAHTAAAAEDFKISIASKKGTAGDQVIVTITAENAAGSEGGQFLLIFDPDLVRPVSAQVGKLVEDAKSSMHMTNLEYAPGQLMVLWVTVYADTADSGTICTIVFDLLKAGETTLKLDEIVVAPGSIGTVAPSPAKITVSSRSSSSDETVPRDSEPADSEQEVGDPADVGDEEIVDEDTDDHAAEDDPDQGLIEDSNDSNLFVYAIGLVVLVFLLTISYFVITRLKKSGTIKIKN